MVDKKWKRVLDEVELGDEKKRVKCVNKGW